MFRFVSSKNPVKLKKAYLAQYNVNLLQKKLDKLMTDYPNIKAALSDDITVKKLLVGNFKYLAKVYSAYTSYLNGKTPEESLLIRSAFVKGGFNYDSHKSKIANFLMNMNNGFDIHNCVYCDLEDVRTFTKADGSDVRKFETEHVLDKGVCPLVALSLYYFVPSCGTYDFDGKVKFEVKVVTPGATDLNTTTHADDYEIDFNIIENIYQKSIDLFELKQRYNNKREKMELLKWRDKRRSNPNNIVQQFADIKKVTFDEMFEEMFELNLRRREHYPMEKARREVMML